MSEQLSPVDSTPSPNVAVVRARWIESVDYLLQRARYSREPKESIFKTILRLLGIGAFTSAYMYSRGLRGVWMWCGLPLPFAIVLAVVGYNRWRLRRILRGESELDLAVEWEFSVDRIVKRSSTGTLYFDWDDGIRGKEVADGFVANLRNRDYVWVPRNSLEVPADVSRLRDILNGGGKPSERSSVETNEDRSKLAAGDILIRYEMNEAEYRRSAKASFDYNLRWPKALPYFGVPILLIGIWKFASHRNEAPPICAIGVILMFFRWMMLSNSVDRFKRHATKGPIEWRLSSNCIGYKSAKGMADIPWARFKKAIEAPNGFLLYEEVKSKDWFWLPLSGFSKPEDVNSARALLREKIAVFESYDRVKG